MEQTLSVAIGESRGELPQIFCEHRLGDRLLVSTLFLNETPKVAT